MTDRPTIATGGAPQPPDPAPDPAPDRGAVKATESASADDAESRSPKASGDLAIAQPEGEGQRLPDATQIGRDAALGGVGDGRDEIPPQSASVIVTTAHAGPAADHTADPGADPSDAPAADAGGAVEKPAAKSEDGSRKKLSKILAEIAADTSRARISVGDLVQELQRRAFGAMLLIFALPNAVPTPPGTSAILGLPLLYLTFQLMMGHSPWLPRFISNRSMSRKDMAALIERISPMLQRAERLLVPRLVLLSTPTAERIAGALCLVLAVVLVLPIPLGNMLPAFAISVIALGILEKDGIWIAAGAVIGVVSLLIVWGVVYALAKAFLFIILHAFS